MPMQTPATRSPGAFLRRCRPFICYVRLLEAMTKAPAGRVAAMVTAAGFGEAEAVSYRGGRLIMECWALDFHALEGINVALW